jgi:hypothetical protein
MRKLGLALSVAVLAVGTAAHAQVSVDGRSAGTTFNNQGFGEGADHVSTATGQNTSYSSIITDTGTSVSFTSGNSVLGQGSSTDSFSHVNFKVTNFSSVAQIAQLGSEITPASMGFYIADTRGGCSSNPATCSQIGSAAALAAAAAAGISNPTSLTDTFSSFADVSGLKASATFSFNVMRGDSHLLSLGGTLILNSDGVFEDASLRSAFAFLGANSESLGNPNSGAIRSWGATDIGPFELGEISGSDGDGFSSVNVSYDIEVSSSVNTSCLQDGACIVAFSAFGDPVGRGGGVENLAPGLFSAGFADGPLAPRPQFITGLTFQDTTITPNASFTPEGGVPEPATWTTLIAGFGLLGAALRRRRVIAYN